MRKALGWLVLGVSVAGWGQTARVQTEAMARTVMSEWPAGVVSTIKKPGEWSYEEGVLLDGLAAEWAVSHNPAELAYVRASVDKYVQADGSIVMGPSGRAFPVDAHTLDDIEMGRAVLFCYRQTRDARYARAAKELHEALKVQPRTASGGYWHKQIYPNQMWLDGAYMAEPFRAEYAATFGAEPGEWADIARQFALMDQHMRDPGTGLLRHGWDESGKMPWADKATGLSPEVWARAMGWYSMALVDVLDWMPAGAERRQLVQILSRTLEAVVKEQDPASGLWWQVMDRGAKRKADGSTTAAAPGNFTEASASAMFVYALEKAGARRYTSEGAGDSSRMPRKAQPALARKLRDKAFAEAAARGWQGLQTGFVKQNGADVVLTGTVKAAGLGGTPYRSGTYDYYVGEARGDQDAKGVGAYLLAGSELGR